MASQQRWRKGKRERLAGKLRAHRRTVVTISRGDASEPERFKAGREHLRRLHRGLMTPSGGRGRNADGKGLRSRAAVPDHATDYVVEYR